MHFNLIYPFLFFKKKKKNMWDYSFCTVYCGRGFVNKKKSCTVNPRNIRKVDVLLCLLRTIVFCELRKKKKNY